MSRETRRELIIRTRVRYRWMKAKRAKGRVLDELCETLEIGRKHAIKVLNSDAQPLRNAGTKPVYGAAEREVLQAVWLAFGQPCGKRLAPVLEDYLRSYERREGRVEPGTRGRLLAMSDSSIDRLLRPIRLQVPRKRRSGRSPSAIRREVPVRAGPWEVSAPGWIEADTVAHCGGSMDGNFAWSLTMTDVFTQWTETRAVWNRGAHGVLARVAEVEAALPFTLLGLDSDNGPEFLNAHLLRYLRDRKGTVQFTRSRPYEKNDNAHVEQKNGTHVRELLGYERIGQEALVEPMNALHRLWSLYANLFRPCTKLLSKTREGHRYRKRYDRPRTPLQRLIESPHVLAATKKGLQALRLRMDPLELLDQIEELKRQVLQPGLTPAERRAASPSALRAAPSGPGSTAWRSAPPQGPAQRPPKPHRQAASLPQVRRCA